MSILDWIIIVLYLAGMIGFSIYLGRSQADQADYFVGGRKLPWWAVGLSTMATQTSAISFISIPAFVALKTGGGLTWLQYELAVPLAMIIVMVFLLPFFRKLQLVSVYEYLEMRFNSRVRKLVSLIFLVSRGLGTGVGVYASAIVLSVCLDIPIWATIIIIAVATVIYDTIGGITAVVYSDVIQMIILLGGIFLCIGYAVKVAGGWEAVFTDFPITRRMAIDPALGIGDGSAVPFWAFLLGGIFLYTAYYGTDQSQVQRELSAASTAETKLSLVWNGLARFPLTLLYVLLGVCMWAVYQYSPSLTAEIEYMKPDYLVPQFILRYLPQGLRALIFAALLAAAMSSLDSALNSLSAATMRDFIENHIRTPDRILFYSKVTTVAWGIAITAFAFFVGQISETVIEAINKIGSAFYGPVLATFIAGITSRRVSSAGVLAGLSGGVLLNLYLWGFEPRIHWMWWNMTGFMVTLSLAHSVSTVFRRSSGKDISNVVLNPDVVINTERRWIPVYVLLVLYFGLILTVLMLLSRR